MLDNETKRRIDSARDILVGKVPDPKSQVEQITIALVYKFMDDIDQESVDMGGKASFFTGEYEKYAWTRIFDARMGGHEMLALYSDAITRMAQNPGLPQLFRDIFKNAFLPYRDPETLKLFLKTINDFKYDHSERLGDAFEYLLSVMASQGDAGQFRTPRHLIDFMVKIVNPQKNETILDPACGTAGFLISAYKHILREHSNGNALTMQERVDLLQNFKGYDISPDMVRLSLVNMYLHGFQQPQIFEYDTLTSEERWNEYADVILANPPFMSPKGGIRPHKRFSVQSNRSEVLFVDYMAEHLTPNGRAAIIVPEGIIFQSANAYKQLRKHLVEQNHLWAVVSLPAGVFQPYSGVKTSILLLDRELAKKTDKILFVKVESDGFDLGAQRKPIEKNDFPQAILEICEIKNIIKNGNHPKENIYKQTNLVPKENIANNGEYNLSQDRYKISTQSNYVWPQVSLGEVADYINGFPFKPEDWHDTGKEIIRIQNLTKSSKTINRTKRSDVPEKYIVRDGDLLISWSATIGFYIWHGEDAYINQHIFKVIPKPIIDKTYLYYLGERITKEILKNVHGNTMQHITKGLFDNINISLPPLLIQQQIVTEIEGYQRIIDGARQVVDNWKPNIEWELEEERRAAGVDAWPLVKLGDVCEVVSGGTPSRSRADYWNGKIPWVGSAVCKDTEVSQAEEYITEAGLKNSSAKLLRKDTTLIALVGATIGKTGYLLFETTTNQNIAGLYPNDTTIICPKFLYYSMQTLYKEFLLLGEGKFRMANLSFIRNLKIIIPNIEIQKTIINRIETEREVIESNQRLIQVYEERIKKVIERVWEG